MLSKKIFFAVSLLILFISCKKESTEQENFVQPPPVIVTSSAFPERFESGSKTDYATADITLATGSWNMADALTGNTADDRKSGNASVRIQNTGSLSMNFDVTNGASVISMYYAKYGNAANSSFELWASVNGGSSWVQVGGTVTVSLITLSKINFGANFIGNVRFQVRKISGGELNIDNINILSNSSTPSQDDNMAMGNPGNAVSNSSFPDNFLLSKQQYSVSYNNSKGTANWVSWHLSTAWKGAAPRCNCFTPDASLPGSFFQVTTSNYTGTGFDRGHLCPSEDRDLSDGDNAATFLMSNIIPQAPNLNQVTWSNLEDYCRTLINNGNELYIIAGGYGAGGSGSMGGTTNTIANGQVTVPARCWKIIVVLPVGSNDALRVLPSTRIIAVDMPNTQTASSQSWGNYRVSVNALQTILGYDFLSNVSPEVQAVIEAGADNGPIH